MLNHLLLALASIAAAPPPAATPVSTEAACLIQAEGGRVLMVRDVWSWRWGLPGGPRRPGEDPGAAAARAAGALLGVELRTLGPATAGGGPAAPLLVPCQPLAALPMLPRHTLMLPDRSRRDFAEARLIDPSALRAQAWRYRSQRAAVQRWMEQARPEQAATVVAAEATVAPGFGTQLAMVRLVQGSIGGPAGRLAMDLASGLGTLWTVTAVIAWIWQRRGGQAGREAFLFVAAATLVGYALKQICALPRPSFLDPTLARQTVYGFGFPSGHSITAAGLALALWPRSPGRARAAAALACAVLACGVARMWWGAHFPHDVLGGWAVVAALAILRRRWPAATSGWAVAALSAASLAVAPSAATAVVVAMTAGVLAPAWVSSRIAGPAGGPLSARSGAAVAGTLATTLAVHWAISAAAPAEGDTVSCVLHLLGHFFALGLALALGGSLWSRLFFSASPRP